MIKKIILIVLALIFSIILTFYFGDKVLGLNNIENVREEIEGLFTKKEDKQKQKEELIPLEVQVPLGSSVLTTYENFANILIKTNQEVSIEESDRFKLTNVLKIEDINYFVLEITNLAIGESGVSFTITGANGESQSFEVSILREPANLPYGAELVEPWPEFQYTVDGNSLTASVDKKHRLLMEYEPEDLVNIKETFVDIYTDLPDLMIRKEAGQSLETMMIALRNETGKNAVVRSAYRSYNEQLSLYLSWLRLLGQEEADRVSARPGFSEHQLGTVIDFVDEESGFDITNDFGNTTAGKWLKENAWEYGFVQSYPEGKEERTGYSREDWHWRYIGIDNAKEYQESGLTLNEWLEEHNNQSK